METGKTIAVVTGASCGMGTEFVRQIGEQKPFIEEVWAIARNREALEKLQREVSKVRVFALDITSPKDLDTLAAALRQERPRIAWLVCSAGAGVQKTVEETGLSDLQNMIELKLHGAYCGDKTLSSLLQKGAPSFTGQRRGFCAAAGFCGLCGFKSLCTQLCQGSERGTKEKRQSNGSVFRTGGYAVSG